MRPSEEPTASFEAAFDPVPTTKSPFVSHIESALTPAFLDEIVDHVVPFHFQLTIEPEKICPETGESGKFIIAIKKVI
jgi:hypothetical protein